MFNSTHHHILRACTTMPIRFSKSEKLLKLKYVNELMYRILRCLTLIHVYELHLLLLLLLFVCSSSARWRASGQRKDRLGIITEKTRWNNFLNTFSRGMKLWQEASIQALRFNVYLSGKAFLCLYGNNLEKKNKKQKTCLFGGCNGWPMAIMAKLVAIRMYSSSHKIKR